MSQNTDSEKLSISVQFKISPPTSQQTGYITLQSSSANPADLSLLLENAVFVPLTPLQMLVTFSIVIDRLLPLEKSRSAP